MRWRWKSEDQEEMIKSDYSNSEISHAIDEFIHSQRDRDVLKRRLIDGLSYDELSVEFHLSIRQVKNIVYKSQDRLFNHIR